MDERRQHPRKNGPFDGSYEGASGRRDARIVDLSESGCFVDVLGAPRQGELVTISVSVRGEPVKLAGEVVYLDKIQGFAVEFVNNPPEPLERLRKLLE